MRTIFTAKAYRGDATEFLGLIEAATRTVYNVRDKDFIPLDTLWKCIGDYRLCPVFPDKFGLLISLSMSVHAHPDERDNYANGKDIVVKGFFDYPYKGLCRQYIDSLRAATRIYGNSTFTVVQEDTDGTVIYEDTMEYGFPDRAMIATMQENKNFYRQFYKYIVPMTQYFCENHEYDRDVIKMANDIVKQNLKEKIKEMAAKNREWNRAMYMNSDFECLPYSVETFKEYLTVLSNLCSN